MGMPTTPLLDESVPILPPAGYYELLSGSHSRSESNHGGTVICYRTGERLLLTSVEAATHLARVRWAADQTPPDGNGDGDGGGNVDGDGGEDVNGDGNDNPWAPLLDGTAVVVIDLINSLDDLPALEALSTAERAGKNRKGVLHAVQARIHALSS